MKEESFKVEGLKFTLSEVREGVFHLEMDEPFIYDFQEFLDGLMDAHERLMNAETSEDREYNALEEAGLDRYKGYDKQ